MSLPQTAVALIGNSKDMWWQLAQMMLTVQLHCRGIIQPSDLLIRIHSRQDRTYVSLRDREKASVSKGILSVIKAAISKTIKPAYWNKCMHILIYTQRKREISKEISMWSGHISHLVVSVGHERIVDDVCLYLWALWQHKSISFNIDCIRCWIY